MAILRVIEAFADFSEDPNGKLYTEGMLVHESDPNVDKHPSRFERVEAAAHRATETAVAAPGLRRSITRPEKKAPSRRAAKKTAAKKKADPKPAEQSDPKGDDSSSEVL